MLAHHLLSLLIWVPIIGGLVIAVIGNSDRRPALVRWLALIVALVTLGLCVPLYCGFNADSYHMQFVEQQMWIPSLGIRYALGIDGISLLFVILTGFTNLIVILGAWRYTRRHLAQYMAIFLVSTGVTIGAFCAMDAMLFYVFYEISMVPMLLGIGIWGGQRRAYAAMKFFLYTFLGSIFLLVAFIYLHTQTGNFSIDSFINLKLSKQVDDWIFLAFLIAFAVKIPMWPLHTWLPDAHTEAPSGGSVVLAALMLKLGAYGFIRFSLPIVPNIHPSMDWLMVALSLIGIVYVGIACVVQTDMKRLIAYSSISHMGIVTLGIFMVYMIVGQAHGHDFLSHEDADLGVQGAMFQMISHAFSSGALFIGVSYLADRFGSRMIRDYQGVAHAMPIFAAFYMLFAMANVGLPGTSGFVGEFMVILAAFKANVWIALIAGLTLVIAPAYTLWMYKRALFGELKPELASAVKQHHLRDIHGSEVLVFVLLAVPVIFFGLYPQAILHLSHAATGHFVDHVITRIPTGTY